MPGRVRFVTGPHELTGYFPSARSCFSTTRHRQSNFCSASLRHERNRITRRIFPNNLSSGRCNQPTAFSRWHIVWLPLIFNNRRTESIRIRTRHAQQGIIYEYAWETSEITAPLFNPGIINLSHLFCLLAHDIGHRFGNSKRKKTRSQS